MTPDPVALSEDHRKIVEERLQTLLMKLSKEHSDQEVIAELLEEGMLKIFEELGYTDITIEKTIEQ
jgi:hypothetical protein